MLVRRAAAAALLPVLLAGGAAACSSGSDGAAAPAPSTTSATAGTSATAPRSTEPAPTAAATPSTPAAACGQLTQGLSNARQVVATAGAKPVLRPALALVLLTLRDEAERGSTVAAPVGPALTELVAAIDDVDAQAGAALPAGADPGGTPVTIDPGRLSAAVDRVESACGSAG